MMLRFLWAWLAISMLVMQPRANAQGAAAARAASRSFADAERRFAAGDFTGAAAAFRRAYHLRPHFSVRCNLALCFERLGDFVSAAREYRACLEEGAAKTPRAPQVRHSLSAAEAHIGHVNVQTPPPGGETFVDGTSVGPTPSRLTLNPGKHVIEVRRGGAHPARSEIEIRGGDELALALVPRRIAPPRKVQRLPPPPPRKRRTRRKGISSAWFWTGVGVTVGATAAAIVLSVQTLSLRDAFETDPTRERYDRGVTRRTAANVMWAVAGTLGASTTVLFFFTDFGGHGRKRAPPRDAGFAVGVQGSF